jgi:hypothetical protein
VSTPRIGLIVNPAAGRDIRRLTGGASVVDNYAKQRVADCVLAGLDVVSSPPDVLVMPDKAGIAANIVEDAPEDVSAGVLDLSLAGSAADSRRAAARFSQQCGAIVVLGGDGTNRDVALECGDIPLLSVSTGTNNVVPTAVDGTIAGAAAALVATGAVDAEAVTDRHWMVEADVESGGSVQGLAAVELVDRSFVGTRAMVDPTDLAGGIVSRASPGEIGLPGIVGALGTVPPTEPNVAFLELTEAAGARRTTNAIVAPGMATEVGIAEHRVLSEEESRTIGVEEAVLGADGERELAVIDAEVTFRSVPDGPRLVSFKRAFAAAARNGVLENDRR